MDNKINKQIFIVKICKYMNLDNIIVEELNRFLIDEAYEREYTNDGDPLYWEYVEKYNEGYILSEFKNNPQKNTLWTLINPNEYQKALNEFVQYGELLRFPSSKIYRWMGLCLKNIALLRANTALNGHARFNDVEAVVYVFFDGDDEAWEDYCNSIGETGWSAEMTFLEEHGFEEWQDSSNVDCDISDYGLAPLERLASSYNENMTPEETLVLINKIIDVVHCNGDLSSLFIQGGAAQLDRISNPQVYSPYGTGVY